MLKNMQLQKRLTAAFMFIGLIVLMVGLVGLSASSRLSDHIKTLSEKSFPSTVNLWKANEAQSRILAGEKVLLANVISNEQRQQELTNIQKAFQDLKEGFDEYEKLQKNPEEEKIYKKAAIEWEKWTAASQEYLQIHDRFMKAGLANPRKIQVELLQQGKTNTPEYKAALGAVQVISEMNDLVVAKLDPTYTTLTNALQELFVYNATLAEQAQKQAKSDISQSTFWIAIGLLVGPLTAVLFGISFSNPIVTQIVGVVDVAKKISSGDLSTQIQPSDQPDELGQLQTAFYTMNKDLNALIKRIQQSGIQITTSSTQIAASGKELEATALEQKASTNEVTATAQEIATTAKKLVKMMERVADMTLSTATSASDSRDELEEMENTMRQLTEATISISSKFGVMNKKAGNINNVVVTITKVADQTNILSLNAAIEAERAGKYGAGFAVVAREIGRLANQTAVATLEIEQIVKDLQEAVTMGVMEMDKFNKSVSDSVVQVNKISHQITKVIDQVQGLPSQFEQVSQSMEEQSQGAQQISEAMEQLNEASQQTVDALRETNRAVEQLDEAARSLREEISHFKV